MGVGPGVGVGVGAGVELGVGAVVERGVGSGDDAGGVSGTEQAVSSRAKLRAAMSFFTVLSPNLCSYVNLRRGAAGHLF